MPGLPEITAVGTLTYDPELRFTASGAAVVSFTVACNDRRFDKDSNSWKDGDATFLRCNLWRQAAENLANSLSKGDRVIVTGQLKQRSYEKDGEKRTVFELEASEVGPSLKFATASVNRASRSGEGGGGFGGQSTPAADPWGGSPAKSESFVDEAPF